MVQHDGIEVSDEAIIDGAIEVIRQDPIYHYNIPSLRAIILLEHLKKKLIRKEHPNF